MGWVVGGVWIGAGAVAVVVLTFCLYEITWKARRVRSGLDRLRLLGDQLADVQRELHVVQRRVADATESPG